MSLFSIEFAITFPRLKSIFIDFEDIIKINLSISDKTFKLPNSVFDNTASCQ